MFCSCFLLLWQQKTGTKRAAARLALPQPLFRLKSSAPIPVMAKAFFRGESFSSNTR
jgi:hypothetical protein